MKCEKCGCGKQVGVMEVSYSLIDAAYQMIVCPTCAINMLENLKPFLIERSVNDEPRATCNADEERGGCIRITVQ